MAHSRSIGEKPWWFVMLQQLSDDYDSGEDSDYPSDSASDSESDTESIGIESTDDESETSDSDHSSDEGFLDDDSED